MKIVPITLIAEAGVLLFWIIVCGWRPIHFAQATWSQAKGVGGTRGGWIPNNKAFEICLYYSLHISRYHNSVNLYIPKSLFLKYYKKNIGLDSKT